MGNLQVSRLPHTCYRLPPPPFCTGEVVKIRAGPCGTGQESLVLWWVGGRAGESVGRLIYASTSSFDYAE